MTTALDLAALAKSAALINFSGSLSINVGRYTDYEGNQQVSATITLHGSAGIDCALENGATPSAWYGSDLPQRNLVFVADGIEICAIEKAPTGTKLVEGILVYPEASEAVQ